MPAVSCPSCRKKLRVPDQLAGRKVTCPRCDEILMVPVELPEAVEEKPVPEDAPPEEEPLPTSARVGIVSLILACVSVMIMCLPVVGYASIALSAVGLPLSLWGLHRSRVDGTQTLSHTLTGDAATNGGFGTRAQHYPLAGVGACLLALALALLPLLFR
jgi:uncharacterized RDD family membrane protein YckC